MHARPLISKLLTFVLLGIFMVSGLILPAGADAIVINVQQTAVAIDDLVLSRCGQQLVYISGMSEYAAGHANTRLEVTVNSALLLTDDQQQANWIFPYLAPTAGEYHVVATIYDAGSGNNPVLASASRVFNVAACSSQPSTSSEGSNGGGGDTDCCPGPDPIVIDSSVPKTAQVKGARTGVTLDRLAPLNQTFRTVFGRTPSFAEWTYWAHRYLTDKPSWTEILGAMQWHQLHGRTMGR